MEYNLEGSYVATQNNILKKISKKDIDVLAKKWLQTNKLIIVLVGDKSKIMPGLEKFGYEIVELTTDGNLK
jgi:zinc protease